MSTWANVFFTSSVKTDQPLCSIHSTSLLSRSLIPVLSETVCEGLGGKYTLSDRDYLCLFLCQ